MGKENEEIKIKHCPFCGKGRSQVCMYELNCDNSGIWRITCGACGSSSGISNDKNLIIAVWNSRPHEKIED